jgi:hypothetical protein
MEKSILALNGLVPLVAKIAIFVLLWVVIFESLKMASFFRSKAVEAIVATCVSLLSVISMFRFLGAGNGTYNVSEKTGGDGTNLDIILLAYAALGVAIVLLSLYLFAGKFLGNDKPNKSLRDAERRTESAFQSDMSKGDRPAEENFGKAFKERGMARDNSRRPKPIDRPMGERVHQSDIHKKTKSNKIKQ